MKKMKKLTFFSLLFCFAISIHAQSNTVEVLIRAFIPNPENAGGGNGFIKPLPDGKSSVQLQNINPDVLNACFLTDNRGFNFDKNASSRLETSFKLTLNSDGTASVDPSQNRTVASVTHKVDCNTGAVLGEKLGSIDLDVIGKPSVSEGKVQVIGQVQGRNLLTVLGPLGPSIDYSFDITWNPTIAEITTIFTIGSFPAFEVYARQPGSDWVPIISELPSGAPWKLGGDGFGINSRNITSTKLLSQVYGKWQATNPEQRFYLNISNNKVVLTEKSQAGNSITKEVRLIEVEKNKYKISRENTDDVLAFLGIQPELRAAALRNNPLPSFLIIYRKDDRLIGEWNGVVITKDNNGKFKEIIQPGVRPPKIYEFSRE